MKKNNELFYGSLFHDIGKIIYRGTSERKTHSLLGWEFLKKFPEFSNKKGVRECLKYHHSAELKGSGIDKRSPAYITYIADNISSGMDRREDETSDHSGQRYVKTVALSSIFNILNVQKFSKTTQTYPFSDLETFRFSDNQRNSYSQGDYDGFIVEMKNTLTRIKCDPSFWNSALQMTESLWSFIPSSTDNTQLTDVSLFDHSKTTTAIACCIEEWLIEQEVENYCEELFAFGKEFYEKEVFQLVSFDFSGIQDFIYTISGENALKSLRARSFYLEVMLEYLADELLQRLQLSRANLLYTGGGHAYFLLSNTKETNRQLAEFEEEVKEYFLENYDISLYVAIAKQVCTGQDLMNKGEKINGISPYRMIYQNLSQKLSEKKARRYTAKEILFLNQQSKTATRECKECKRSLHLLEDEDSCALCTALKEISNEFKDKNFFTVEENGILPLPFGKSLNAYKKEELKHTAENFERVYTKNNPHMGEDMATNLWMGDYDAAGNFKELLKDSSGIQRLGVLRADVDHLGQAFIHGISDESVSISRTSTFSRQLSMFFKYHLNTLLKEKNRKVRIIYSGGDDVFLIGQWWDILEASLDLRNEFERFTQGKLHLSAGIGMFPIKTPVAQMARQTGILEEMAKLGVDKNGSRNALCLFTEEVVLSWTTFETIVMKEQFHYLAQSLGEQSEKGKAMIYKIVDLLRDTEERTLNIARLAYMLARIREEEKLAEDFSEKIYQWATSNESRETLIQAFEIYVYKTRGEG